MISKLVSTALVSSTRTVLVRHTRELMRYRTSRWLNGRTPWLSQRLFSSTTASESSSPLKVGFVGLGNMGLPMCLNLLSKKETDNSTEFQVLAFDINDIALAECEMGGVVPATSLKEVRVSDCNVIVTSLPGCDAVNHVMEELLVKEDQPPKLKRTFLDCSTVNPTTSRHWHNVTSQMGHEMLDAPVSGGVRGATNGTLTFMVGCASEEVLENVGPVFDKMGSTVMHCGGPGTGSATKLCNNLALATQMIGICEAMNLGDALGVDPIVLANVMNSSTAACWSSKTNNPHPKAAQALNQSPASDQYKGGFGTKLMLKDLTLAVGAGNDAHVSLPLGTTAKELYHLAEKRGLGNKDFGVMLEFLNGK